MTRGLATTQLAVGAIAEPTNENVLFALEPRVVMAAMQTTTMRATITAYSAAVGPSSCFRNFTSFFVTFRMMIHFRVGGGGQRGALAAPTSVFSTSDRQDCDEISEFPVFASPRVGKSDS